MKKLLFGIGICVLFVAASCNKQKQVLLAPSGKTLNGIPGGEANTMVTNFINNPGVYDKNTHANIWFSRPVFASMYKYLKDNNGNGMRIYFAKNTGTNKNSIVIVSTRANSTGTINVDFFQDPSYPTSADLRGVNSYDSTNGALLYTDKPVLPKDDGCDSSDNHYISNEKAYLMVNNYGVDQINDTSEWFDIGLFDALSKALTADSSLDGIRIYYARQLHPDPKSSPKDIYRHCFVFMTTTRISDTNHPDKYTCITLPGNKGGNDNGEQCPYACNGVTWASTLPF